MRRIRIALCQIQSHPALIAGPLDLLDEPFVPAGRASLARMASFGLEIEPLQERCRAKYIAWARARQSAILEFLGPLRPDVVLFPELGVPLELLPEIASWSAKARTVVLAGSHTPIRLLPARRRYESMGVDDEALNGMFECGSTNVLPVVAAGRTTLVPKRLHSPFEQLDTGLTERALPSLAPLSFETTLDFTVLPLICSEALRQHNIASPYDLAGVVSYERRPVRFEAFANQQVANKHAVAYCNDGAFGGSRLFALADSRRPLGILDGLPSGLPPCDAILVLDLDLDALAIEVGVSAPAVGATLVRIAEVHAEGDPVSKVSRSLTSIRSLSDPARRSNDLRSMLERSDLTPLLRMRAEYLLRLESKGAPSEASWEALAGDCVVRDRPSLADLESSLAADCVAALTPALAGVIHAGPEKAAIEVVSYIAECQSHVRTEEPFGSKSAREVRPV